MARLPGATAFPRSFEEYSMDTRLYDVFLTGKLTEGVAREQAAARMAQLFKAQPETMLGLLTGKPQLLKRGVDRDTALKYREALQRAGVEVAFRPQPQSAPVPAAAPAPAATAAEPAYSLSLAPPGSDVLSPAERARRVEPPSIEVDHLSAAEAGAPLEELPRAGMAPELPDLDHLTLRAAEGDLLGEDERTQLPAMVADVPEFTLAPAGADLETLPDERPPVAVDLAGLALAPEGTELLTPEQRLQPEATAPATDHLQLAP